MTPSRWPLVRLLPLLVFRPPVAQPVASNSAAPMVAGVATLLLMIFADRLSVGRDAVFYPWALGALLWWPLACAGIASLGRDHAARTFVLLMELTFLHTILALFLWPLAGDAADSQWAWRSVLLGWWATTVGYALATLHAPRRIIGHRTWSLWLLAWLPWLWLRQFLGLVWEPPVEASTTALSSLPSAERLFAAQSALLTPQLRSLKPHTPGVRDHYMIALGGDAEQDVFREEALFARALFDRRFNTAGRSLALINSTEAWQTLPLATLTHLQSSLAAISQRMDAKEDVLYVFLTSHGSENAELAIRFGDVSFEPVNATQLRRALDDAGIQWRVLIISACYSGSFIEPLQTPYTLILTAASADRTSFGCSHERHFTYFGEALLGAYLNRGMPLLEAFDASRRLIEAREQEEGLTPSMPTLWMGEAMATRLESPEHAAMEGGGDADPLPVKVCVSCERADLQPSSTTKATAYSRSSDKVK